MSQLCHQLCYLAVNPSSINLIKSKTKCFKFNDTKTHLVYKNEKILKNIK